MERIQAQISIGVHFCRDAMEGFERLAPVQRGELQSLLLSCLIGDESNRDRFLELQRGALWNPWLRTGAGGSEPLRAELERALGAALAAYNRGRFGLRFAQPTGKKLRRTCVQWIWRRGEFVPLYNYGLEPRRSAGGPDAPSSCLLPWSDEARSDLGIARHRSLQARYELELTYRRTA